MAKRERDDGNPVAESETNQDHAKMVFAGGRGKVGKSVTLRVLIEQYLRQGGEPIIADGDRTNPTLFAFFPDAKRPTSAEDDDVKDWLNNLVDDQIENQTTCFLDLGGGDQTLKQWSRDLDLAPFLEKNGITPILLHLIGGDIDDLSYLRDLETVFAPEKTVIVLNEGMVPTGRSSAMVFEPVVRHPIFKAATDRGAIVVKLPRLGCMQEIDRRRLSFADAEEGKVKSGQDRIGPTMRQMIHLWRKEVAASFTPIATWIS